MNLPKIEFVYSGIYDSHWMEYTKLLNIPNYPVKEEILKRIGEAENYWKDSGEKILTSIAKNSNLEWKSSEIKCYVVGKALAFSKPLTLPLYTNKSKDKDLDSWMDVLTHELIHNILVENSWGKFENLMKFIKTQGDLAQKTINHIPVHAIHALVYKDIFSDDRLNLDIQKCSENIPYKKSWEIVQNSGAEEIVKMFN